MLEARGGFMHTVRTLTLTLAIVLSLALTAASCGGGPSSDAGIDADVGADADVNTDGDVEESFEPTGWCPGSPECLDEGDEVLYVGASAVDITPLIDSSTETLTVDHDEDGEYDPSEDEYEDVNMNGRFDGLWLGGFGNARAASGIETELTARAVALRRNETTVVLVSVDCLSLFYEDVQAIRDLVTTSDVDYISVTATRTHSAPDTLGFWGPSILEPGVDENYMNDLRAGAAEAVDAAVAHMEPARVESTSFRLRDHGGMLRYVTDSRDPKIIDDEVRSMRFVSRDVDTTIATIVNLSARGDYSGTDNQLISGDIAYHIRDVIENGLEEGPADAPVEGIGGTALFFPGAFGSQIGSGEARSVYYEEGFLSPVSWDGTPVDPNGDPALAELIGRQIGYYALQALHGAVEEEDDLPLGFRYFDFRIAVYNAALHAAFGFRLMPNRIAYDYDERLPPGPDNLPWIQSQASLIDIGQTTVLTVPGHLDPALFIGGYDGGSNSPRDVPFIDEERCESDLFDPNISNTPEPLIEAVRSSLGTDRRVMLFGVTNDELGYFIIPSDFRLPLDESRWYYEQADPYCHYEETFALGPDAWTTVESHIHALLDWSPAGEL